MNIAARHALYDMDPDMSSNFDAEPDPKSIRHPLLHCCCLNLFFQEKIVTDNSVHETYCDPPYFAQYRLHMCYCYG
jgi:hypothetical protein